MAIRPFASSPFFLLRVQQDYRTQSGLALSDSALQPAVPYFIHRNQSEANKIWGNTNIIDMKGIVPSFFCQIT